MRPGAHRLPEGSPARPAAGSVRGAGCGPGQPVRVRRGRCNADADSPQRTDAAIALVGVRRRVTGRNPGLAAAPACGVALWRAPGPLHATGMPLQGGAPRKAVAGCRAAGPQVKVARSHAGRWRPAAVLLSGPSVQFAGGGFSVLPAVVSLRDRFHRPWTGRPRAGIGRLPRTGDEEVAVGAACPGWATGECVGHDGR